MKLSSRLSNAKRAKPGIARALVCSAVLLVLPGCFIPKLRPANTGVVLPATYDGPPGGMTNGPLSGTATPDNSAQLRVDEFYNDPTLLRLVCQAVANNRELKMLEEDVQIARATVLARRGAFLPLIGLRAGVDTNKVSTFTLEGAGIHDDPYLPGKLLPNPISNFMLGINFAIPVDIWRELRNNRDAATQRYAAAIERRNYFVTRLVADIAESYYGLMALDQRLTTLNNIIAIQQKSLDTAKDLFAAARVTELPVQRFEAEVRKNQSEKLIVSQEIVEVENRINFLAGRPPQPVERNSTAFFDLTIHALRVGVPAQLLLNRPDIRQAEREIAASGLDVQIARAHFFPRVDITGGFGYQAFNPKYLFNPDSLIFNAAGELVAPLINKAAIRADYRTANARQLQSVYDYQRVILNAVTEVVNQLSKVENYSRSIELKRLQLAALEKAVPISFQLFQAVRIEYIDVLISQRDLLDARTVLINTKREQLTAIVHVYQALGGGTSLICPPPEPHLDAPNGQLPTPRMQMDPPEPPRLPDALPPVPGKEKKGP